MTIWHRPSANKPKHWKAAAKVTASGVWSVISEYKQKNGLHLASHNIGHVSDRCIKPRTVSVCATGVRHLFMAYCQPEVRYKTGRLLGRGNGTSGVFARFYGTRAWGITHWFVRPERPWSMLDHADPQSRHGGYANDLNVEIVKKNSLNDAQWQSRQWGMREHHSHWRTVKARLEYNVTTRKQSGARSLEASIWIVQALCFCNQD